MADAVDIILAERGRETFDVFLSYNSRDLDAVESIAERLKQKGLRPWFDQWDVIPGDLVQESIENALDDSVSCAVFVGPSGLGPWHNEEARVAIERRITDGLGRFRVIPVLLPGASKPAARKPGTPRFPSFLLRAAWVEFRKSIDEEDVLHRLISGVRGTAPGAMPQAQQSVRWVVILDGELSDMTKSRVEAIVKDLQKLTADGHVTFKRMEPGSVKIILESSPGAFKCAEDSFAIGQLRRLSGFKVSHLGDSFFADLHSALSTFNWAEAERLCKRLIDELNRSTTRYPELRAKQILQLLRRKRQFALMVSVGDALIRAGQFAPQILRQYAQAMIDQGNLAASQAVLNSIISNAGASLGEKAEAKGLLGRIYKQLYVDANDASNPRQQQNLREALQHYFSVYETAPKSFLWHGINVVALLARAQRDRVSVPGLPPLRDIAFEIDSFLKQVEPLQYWDRATAIEAALALGDFTAAYEHTLNYASDQEADAFEIASLLRQLTDVWQLRNDAAPGDLLLPILQTAQLKREGGGFRVDPRKVSEEANIVQSANERLEKVFGTDRYEPVGWLRTALKRCEAVARVDSVTGKRIGTGCLVKASDFFPNSDKNELLFLTNAHIISPSNQPFPGAIPPDAATIVFEASGKVYRIEKLVWSSPPGALDATFLTIESLDGTEFCPLAPQPERFEVTKKPRVYIIGYPLGAGLSISLQDSIWLDTDGRLLHYRTPTEPGSSGSPVFDQHYWTLIGLHHSGRRDMPQLRGSGAYEANEGIAISAIRQATLAPDNGRAAHA